MLRASTFLATPMVLASAIILGFGASPLDSISYSNKSEISSYTFDTGSGGVELFGNNFFLNHPTKELADIDNSRETSNSSGYKIDISIFSDAFLVVAWDSGGTLENLASNYISVSTSGIKYATYRFDDIFSHKNTSIGILKLDGYRFAKSDTFYVSLPMLEDSRSLDAISKAGWWILGAEPSSGNRTKYSIDFNASAESILALGLFSVDTVNGKDSLKIPNDGFTAILDNELGNSFSGEHHFGTLSSAPNINPLLFVSKSESPQLVPSVSLKLEEDVNSAGYHTVLMDMEIPQNFLEDEVIIEITKPNFYVENSMSVPFGLELSGPLTDRSGDDVFSYYAEESSMVWRLNVGLEQLNRASRTQFRFLAKEITAASTLRATISIPSLKIKEYSNALPIPKNRIDDLSIYATYTAATPTRGEITALLYSDLKASGISSLKFSFVSHIAIPDKTLKGSKCEIVNNQNLVCEVEFQNGIASLSLNVFTRLEAQSYGIGTVEIINVENDPNLANNKTGIVVVN